MRRDIDKLMCERARKGSRNRSLKTALKLSTHLDYESLDYDWGPTFTPKTTCGSYNPARRLAPMFKKRTIRKVRDIRWEPLLKILKKSVGQQWDDVYSELCAALKGKHPVKREVLTHLGCYVTYNVVAVPYYRARFFVDDEGYLRNSAPTVRQQRKKESSDKLHWKGLTYFERKMYQGPAVGCRCVHFKMTDALLHSSKYLGDAYALVCIHGHAPTNHVVWEVVEYAHHQPDKVYNVCEFGKCGSYWEAKLGLTADNPIHKTYYRDVPDIMAIPYKLKDKTANRRELKLIKAMLEEKLWTTH